MVKSQAVSQLGAYVITQTRLDCDVRQPTDVSRPIAIGSRGLRLVGHDTDDHTVMAKPQPPQIDLVDPIVVMLDGFPNAFGHPRIATAVQQDRRGVAHQLPRPTGDQRSTSQADKGIGPPPAKMPSERRCHDGTHRSHSVGERMDVGRAQVVVGVDLGMVVIVMVGVAIPMAMVVTQQARLTRLTASPTTVTGSACA